MLAVSCLPRLWSGALRSGHPFMGDAEWSYTTLVDALDAARVVRGDVYPDASLRVLDSDGAAHTLQLLPAQVTAVVERFVDHHVDVSLVPPPPLLVLVRQTLEVAPLLLVLAFVLTLTNRGSFFSNVAAGSRGGGGAPIVEAGPEIVQTRFVDVAGMRGPKEELAEVVSYLKDPSVFHASGARAPRGILLEGPPGTGKTMLARAVAGEAGVPFLATTASSFVEMYVGLGAARVRALFERARRVAPCIVWIDEIDAVARRRSGGAPGAAPNDEREATLNELLSAMDGFEEETGVLVLAATNRAEVLDEAILRPGRFDRRVGVRLPDVEERRAILLVHVRGKTLDAAVSVDDLAARTVGFSGAELANLLNEAAIRAARRSSATIVPNDVEEALDRVVAGLPLPAHQPTPTRERVAVHEAGHTLVATALDEYDAVSRVTIVPRSSGMGGFTSFLPSEEHLDGGLMTRDYLEARLCVLLAGRAAEQLVIGSASSGASDDLERVRETARRMVLTGLADGPLPSGGDAETSRAKVDAAVEAVVDAAEARAWAALEGHRDALRRLIDALLDEGTLDGDQVRRLVDEATD